MLKTNGQNRSPSGVRWACGGAWKDRECGVGERPDAGTPALALTLVPGSGKGPFPPPGAAIIRVLSCEWNLLRHQRE